MKRVPLVVAVVCALALPPVLAWFGLSRTLGAHPFWDFRTALIGAPVGVVAGLAASTLTRWPRIAVAVAVLAAATAMAVYGKTRFAASYAEDALAGKLWYFGWIGIAAGLSLTVMAVLTLAQGAGVTQKGTDDAERD